MKCPFKCGGDIVKLPYFDEGLRKEVWVHTETREKCKYKDDGINVNVIDPFLQLKFQELIKEEKEKSLWNRIKKRFNL